MMFHEPQPTYVKFALNESGCIPSYPYSKIFMRQAFRDTKQLPKAISAQSVKPGLGVFMAASAAKRTKFEAAWVDCLCGFWLPADKNPSHTSQKEAELAASTLVEILGCFEFQKIHWADGFAAANGAYFEGEL